MMYTARLSAYRGGLPIIGDCLYRGEGLPLGRGSTCPMAFGKADPVKSNISENITFPQLRLWALIIQNCTTEMGQIWR